MNSHKISILVVDDEPMLLEILQFTLEDRGCTVRTASCGNDAFKMTKEQHFDVIISDIKMPNGTGIELLQNINSLDYRPLFFFVTGYSSISREQALALGAKDLFDKPLQYEFLYEQIKELQEC